MPRDLAFRRAIAHAERVLPGGRGTAASDRRWRAIIRVSEFANEYPVEVCDFALKWAKHPGIDLGSAVSCGLLEDLVADHFELLFPRMRKAALASARVAEHFEDDNWGILNPADPATVPRLRRLKALAKRLRREREERRKAARRRRRRRAA